MKKMIMLMILVLGSASCSGEQNVSEPVTLRVMTHDSFESDSLKRVIM